MESEFRSKYFVPGSIAIIVVLSIYNFYIFSPSAQSPESEAPVVQASVVVDPQLAQRSLEYLVKTPDVAKVVIREDHVYIGLAKQPDPATLASLVQGAARNYAEAIGGEVYAHGTHERQLALIGTSSFSEYCNSHSGVRSVLGPEGEMVNRAEMLGGTC